MISIHTFILLNRGQNQHLAELQQADTLDVGSVRKHVYWLDTFQLVASSYTLVSLYPIISR